MNDKFFVRFSSFSLLSERKINRNKMQLFIPK